MAGHRGQHPRQGRADRRLIDRTRAGGDTGTGLFASAAGVLVFGTFLFAAVQLLFGLYATSTVSAVVDDAAVRAAGRGSADLDDIDRDLRGRLAGIDPDLVVEWRRTCVRDDLVELHVVVEPPRFVPPSVADLAGIGTVDRTATARCERLR